MSNNGNRFLRLDCVHARMCPPYRLVTLSGELDLLSDPCCKLTVQVNNRETVERERCSTVVRDSTQPRHLEELWPTLI